MTHICRPVVVGALGFLWILCVGGSTRGFADQRWAWFAAYSAIDKWSVGQGEAKVEISKDDFFAELYDGEGSSRYLYLTLRGKLRGVRVEVIAIARATDDVPRKLLGVYKKTRWKDGGGREAIVFTQPDEPWGLTIGLTREFPGP